MEWKLTICEEFEYLSEHQVSYKGKMYISHLGIIGWGNSVF